MRTILTLTLLAIVVSGCRCGPDSPTPVTFRIKNSGRSPLWVDATDGRLGVQVQRNVNGDWLSFVEQPACECQRCENICADPACECAEPASKVQKINAGDSTERTWEGFVQIAENGSCDLIGGPACLQQEIPSIDETFRAQFCYALSVPVTIQSDGGTPVAGRLPDKGVSCVSKEFTVRDGLVEVSPERGQSCTAHSECKGPDELCLEGQCTTACPTNDFPQLGSGGWQFSIDEPDDQGFFSLAQNGAVKTYTGTGAVSSVRYDNSIMTLRLSRPAGASGSLIGTVYVQLPGTYAVAFNVGEQVSVTLIDKSSSENFGQRAIVVRDAGGVLLLAADTAQKERVLDDAATSPFTVNTEGEIAGCAPTDCGKQLQSRTVFGYGAERSEVAPGSAPSVVVGNAVFRLLNAANGRLNTTTCNISKFTPYAILNTRETP